MAQSIRISDRLYEEATTAASVAQRSLAQQVEYWARIGLAAEEAGLTQNDLVQLLLKAQQAKDKKRIAAGEIQPQDLAMLSKAQVKRAKIAPKAIDYQRAMDDYR